MCYSLFYFNNSHRPHQARRQQRRIRFIRSGGGKSISAACPGLAVLQPIRPLLVECSVVWFFFIAYQAVRPKVNHFYFEFVILQPRRFGYIRPPRRRPNNAQIFPVQSYASHIFFFFFFLSPPPPFQNPPPARPPPNHRPIFSR